MKTLTGHDTRINQIDQGAGRPPRFQAVCSCGETGRTHKWSGKAEAERDQHEAEV